MKCRSHIISLFIVMVILAGCRSKGDADLLYINSGPNLINDLEAGFKNPPLFARPRVFWWWLNSMATKESITRDLEELKAKGFGGALIFDAGSSNYKIAKKTAAGPVFASDEWKKLFAFALKEADRLGLEMSLNIQSGWNPGGPTVIPQDAMKKVVWAEKKVIGPGQFAGCLPQPAEKFYKDIAIHAYPLNSAAKHPPLMHWELKSFNKIFGGFDVYPLYILRHQLDPAVTDFDVKSESLLDLTELVQPNGYLEWDIPPGEWQIVRIGSALTWAQVSTSSDGYDGLSFDHLSTRALENFFADVVDPILAGGGEYVGKSLKYLHTDSWEMGRTNWTDNMISEFKQRRGYDPTPYLSTLTGRIVDNREVSNRFLYDFRKTVSDCIADRMYAEFARMAHERGLLVHPESGGPHAAPIDGLKCLGRNDVPMGEFWARANTHRFKEDHRLFIKQSASAAHIYGKRFVAGEGPTSIGPQWERAPKDLKSVFDRNFCEGINRFFWHSFTSSPKEFGLPGNEYFAGTHLNPNTTWWGQSKAFIDYLSRSSFLLSQGLFQADVCLYYGDDVPNFVPRKHTLSGLGFGYDYDESNAEVIQQRMAVKDGRIVLPDGMSYRLLRLPDRAAITPKVLYALEKLVKCGATIVGPKPNKSTGLKDYPDSDKKIQQLAERMWGACDGIKVLENRYGKGRVFWGKPMAEILRDDGVPPDFGFTSSQDSTQLDFIHRRAKEADIYFVVNRWARRGIYDTNYRYLPTLPDRYERVDCRFRTIGKRPEIWNPQTGEITPVLGYREEGSYTVVPLFLEPEGSRFIVFRKPAKGDNIVKIQKDSVSLFPLQKGKPAPFPAWSISKPFENPQLEYLNSGHYKVFYSQGGIMEFRSDHPFSTLPIQGDWLVHFTKGWGAPEELLIRQLKSWTAFDDPGIRYYSGVADYENKFRMDKIDTTGHHYYLDLGNVQELAEVTLNGRNLGVLWMPPFRRDVTAVIKPGENRLQIRVVNLWPNRLIGDQFLPEGKRFTRTNIQKFNQQSKPRISGLLGPVQIVILPRKELN